MTGPAHYREAERLNALEPFCMCERTDCEHGKVLVARAQVHATLALAAANVDLFAPATASAQAWREVTS